MNNVIKVILTEDQSLFRLGLISLLEKENIVVIGEASNGVELLKLLEHKGVKPDIILLDLEMPVMTGSVALVHLKEKFPEIKVIILTGYAHKVLKIDFLEKGADAFLDKDTQLDILVETIKKVYYLRDYKPDTEEALMFFTLSEAEVIPYLLRGKTSREIAKILHKSTRTIESIRDNLYQKTDTKNIAEFSAYCGSLGLLHLGSIKSLKQQSQKKI